MLIVQRCGAGPCHDALSLRILRGYERGILFPPGRLLPHLGSALEDAEPDELLAER